VQVIPRQTNGPFSCGPELTELSQLRGQRCLHDPSPSCANSWAGITSALSRPPTGLLLVLGCNAIAADDDDEEQRADELILDRPRDRKRRVRFEDDYSELSDEDLMQAAPAAAPAGSNRGRGRGSGRRGRPPKYGGAGATGGRGSSGYGSMAGLPVGPAGAGQQSGAGMQPISGYMYSGPGNVFNPSNTTYQQQQQHWP